MRENGKIKYGSLDLAQVTITSKLDKLAMHFIIPTCACLPISTSRCESTLAIATNQSNLAQEMQHFRGVPLMIEMISN